MRPNRFSPSPEETATPEEVRRAFEVARLIVEEGWSQERIAGEWFESRSTIQRLWALAERAGIYHQCVLPPMERAALDGLRGRLVETFRLKDAVLVPGRMEMLDDALSPETREAIFLTAARGAADYLDRSLRERDVLCLAWGRTVHAVLRCLRPSRPLPGLTVVPLLGVLSVRPDLLEANLLVQDAAAAYQTARYTCLPIPAIVRDEAQKRISTQLLLVAAALEQIQQATFVVTSLAPPDPEHSTLVRRDLLASWEVRSVVDRGAVGEICAWWFDSSGEPVHDDRIWPIGLGLEGLRRLVRGSGTVLTVVAADRRRIDPLLAALKAGLVNVLSTDSVTAQELLRGSGREQDMRGRARNVPGAAKTDP